MKLLALGLGVAAGLLGGALLLRAARAAAPPPPPPRELPDDARERGPVEVPPPSAKAVRYHRGNNVIWAVEQALALVVPAALLLTGLSARMRTLARRAGRGRFYPTLVVYLALLSLVMFVIDLPLSYYVGYAREHAYGLSAQRFGKWAADQLKGLGVGFAIGALTLWVPYKLLAKSPRRWWLWTGALTLPFFTVALLVGPIWIAPLFNKFGPMHDKTLETAVLAEAQRAGIEGARVFEVNKSVDTEKVNAYVTGIGGTKRIVLWDTLLKRLTPRQTLFVVGHEIGHYVLGHVWHSILFSSALVLAGLYAAHRSADLLLGRFGGRFGFDNLADVASMPLLALLLSVFSLLLTPASLAFSRHHEHEADKYGLALTCDNHAAATAFIALQQQNLAVPRPGWLYTVFRASHPPIGERVDFINAYHPCRDRD
jgi:Zn-dependent protease with chaperone function